MLAEEELIQILTAGIGSVCFSLLFGLKGKKLYTIGLGGSFAWFIFLLGRNQGMALVGLFGAVVAAATVAEIEARRIKTPVIVMEVPLLVPLIPGGDLYRMVESVMKKGIVSSIDTIVWLIQEVFLIAAGVILVSTVFLTYTQIKRKVMKNSI